MSVTHNVLSFSFTFIDFYYWILFFDSLLQCLLFCGNHLFYFYRDLTDWLPHDATSGCGDSQNRLQIVLHVFIYVCWYMRIYVSVCLYVCACKWIYVYMFVCICMFVFVYMFMCVCIYMYMYLYVCIYKCIYIYMYILFFNF